MSTWLELQVSDDDEIEEKPLEAGIARRVLRRRRTKRPARSLHTAIAVATHHLRAPLAGALANLEILEEATLGDLSEAQRMHLRFAHDGLLELERTVGDLLALARLQDGPVPLHCRTFDAAVLLGEIRTRMAARARQVGVQLILEGCDGPAPVATDPKYLDYLLTELVENAVRYGGDPGLVRICLQPVGWHSVRIEVIDNGPGVPDGDAERVFDPFYQRPAHTSHQARGTGMGLAIVKRLSELLHARIELRNPAEGGCAFAVELPGKR